MTAFEQDVSVGERGWPEVADLEASNYAGWVALFDAELAPVALVPAATAAVVCEVLNRFEHDVPVDYDEKNNPIWESLPDLEPKNGFNPLPGSGSDAPPVSAFYAVTCKTCGGKCSGFPLRKICHRCERIANETPKQSPAAAPCSAYPPETKTFMWLSDRIENDIRHWTALRESVSPQLQKDILFGLIQGAQEYLPEVRRIEERADVLRHAIAGEEWCPMCGGGVGDGGAHESHCPLENPLTFERECPIVAERKAHPRRRLTPEDYDNQKIYTEEKERP